MVELIENASVLRIVPLRDEISKAELAEAGSMTEVLEEYLCNGWDMLFPEDIGALVGEECLMLSQEVERDDLGVVGKMGIGYYDHRYQVHDPLEELKRGHTLVLPSLAH